jgi:SAM-dependent methyltransferase
MAESVKSNMFDEYATFYDALYTKKNYESECDFIETVFHRFGTIPVKTVLDLGCGTGGHAIPLSQRGYGVVGVDRSRNMLNLAKRKAIKISPDIAPEFVTGDIQDIDLKKEFDAITCMFAVLSYQVSNAELHRTLQNARRHIRSGGVFVGDFWYGPAVLHQRPEERILTVRQENNRIIRTVKPEIDTRENTVTVHYELLHIRDDRLIAEITENHLMRFFFKPEIAFHFTIAGFKLQHLCPFGTLDTEIDETTWNVVAIAIAI